MGISYFLTILKESGSTPKACNPPSKSISPKNNEVSEPSPKTKENMRKVKSEEDFMKVQVPWIL